MIRFAEAQWLHLLWLLPPLALAAWISATRTRRSLARYAHWPTLRDMLSGWSPLRLRVKSLLGLGGLALLVLALAAPQVGTKLMEVKRRGVDVILAVDVSQSMAAQDFSPSRMARARHSIRRLLEELRGDRVALLPFAGSAFLQNPLTTDYNLVGMLVDLLHPGLIPVPGTDLGAPIREALRAFGDTSEQHRVLVVLSDGEDFEGDWESAVEEAREQGVLVYCVGLATPEGAPVPDPQRPGAYKQDAGGSIVLSRLNEEVLIELARRGGGDYYRSSPAGEELVAIRERIDLMEKRELGSRIYSGWQHRYQWFLAPGLLLVLLSALLPAGSPGRRRPDLAHAANRSAGRLPGLLIPLALMAASQALGDPADPVARGNRSYAEGDFGGAAASYQEALREDPRQPVARFNLADARFRSGDLDAAETGYRQLADAEGGIEADYPGLPAAAYYNLGNVHLARQQPQEALEAYIQSLLRDPGREDAKFNLELARLMLEQQQQQEQEQEQEGQQDQDAQDQRQDEQQPEREQSQEQEQEDQEPQDSGESESEQQDRQEQQESPGREEPREGEEQPPPPAASPEEAPEAVDPEQLEQILRAVEEMERQAMEKQLQAIPAPRRTVEKDW